MLGVLIPLFNLPPLFTRTNLLKIYC